MGPPSPGSWSHGEAAPEEACALVRATGSWLPWEWDKPAEWDALDLAKGLWEGDKPDRARARRRA